MAFGSCCILKRSGLTKMEAESIKIEGVQHGLMLNFKMTQTFMNPSRKQSELYYIFPNDFKFCIYNTTFVVGDKIIEPKLVSKEEAEKIYQEAVKAKKTVIYGSNISHGLTKFKLGNLPPNVECKVIIKIAFIAQLISEKKFFFKFPLDVYDPSGSIGCLDTKYSEFFFKLQSEKEKIMKIRSNIKNGIFDENTKIFTINKSIKNKENQNSIIITFECYENIQSSALITTDASSSYEYCALTLAPNLPLLETSNCEFVFVIDCSGSMCGNSIKNASECLELFIKSLPSNSYFNVIRFGSEFVKLFDQSMKYTEETAYEAIQLAQTLQSNLGGTNILSPLDDIFKEKPKQGQRQIFIMTDGEVGEIEPVLELIEKNSYENRCFSIGIGRGSDADLVEGIANISGGTSDFVQEGDMISEKVIPQLQSSFQPSLKCVEIHIQNKDSFEISPFPIPSINANGAISVFLCTKKEKKEFEWSIIIEGLYREKSVEILVENIEIIENTGENDFVDSDGGNIGKAIVSLFSFSVLQSYDRKQHISDEDKEKATKLSIRNGILCKYTGYVGMIADSEEEEEDNNGIIDTQYSVAPHRKTLYAKTPHKIRLSSRKTLYAKASYFDAPRSNGNFFNFKSQENFQEKTPKNDDLLALTRLQKISGFWNDIDAVNTILKLKIYHIDGISIIDEKIEKSCVATIVAIAAINVKFASEKNSLILIEQKAITWLKEKLPDVDINEIITATEKLIN